jgi:hypothetical protein
MVGMTCIKKTFLEYVDFTEVEYSRVVGEKSSQLAYLNSKLVNHYGQRAVEIRLAEDRADESKFHRASVFGHVAPDASVVCFPDVTGWRLHL